MPLLEIQDLSVEFGGLRAVDGVSLSVPEGGALCVVGESGCGKSVTALSIARLLPEPPARYAGGRIVLGGRDVLGLDAAGLRAVRGRMVRYVFQEPGASLNPVLRLRTQLLEILRLHRPDAATDAEAARLLSLVGIPAPERRLAQYPHELSGGMQQRVMLAMALASEPRLLVADEPTTALDVTIQAQILELLLDLRRRTGMALLLITHNLGIVRGIADRVAVMYAGQVVEEAASADLLERPLHPYTRALLASVPALGRGQERLAAIPGTVPPLGQWPGGCRFAPRCPVARRERTARMPALEAVDATRSVRCPFHG